MPKVRGKGNRQIKPVLHILCEGEKTEPNYLNGYLRKYHSCNRRLKVIKIEKTNKNTPVQLVAEAIKLKNDPSSSNKDIFWVVYDREAKSKYSDNLHKKALDKAKSKGISVAFTNVCFEVWILLHIEDLTSPYSSCTDLLRTSSLKASLKALGIANYDKADKAVFDAISDNIPLARQRARNMNKSTLKSSFTNKENPHLLNPYTTVHELLDAIDKFVEKSS